MTFVAPELSGILEEPLLFSQVAALEGKVFRDVPGRKTFRVVLGNNAYFAKVHYGVGWREIFKNLAQLRLPVLGASNEWHAIKKLEVLGVETLTAVAYTSEGKNPAAIHSCIVTKALDNTISLEDLVLQGGATLRLKRELTQRVARVAQCLHSNGMNHRDFYICHFLLSRDSLQDDCVHSLHLIDLHRMQIRQGAVPLRWREKDLAGLLFSAADAGINSRDVMRFIRVYGGRTLRESLRGDAKMWERVTRKAAQLYKKDHGQESPFLALLMSRQLVHKPIANAQRNRERSLDKQ